MFDVGYSELLVIAIVLIVVIGPKDLPKMLRAFGKAMTRFRQVSGDFRRQFDDALKEAELGEVKKVIDSARSLDPRQQIRDALNPLKSAMDDVKRDVMTPKMAPGQIIPKVSDIVATPVVASEPVAVAAPRKVRVKAVPIEKPVVSPATKPKKVTPVVAVVAPIAKPRKKAVPKT